MNPLKPILSLLFSSFCLSASIPNSDTDSYDLKAGSYTFIVATINSPDEYPVIIEALKAIDGTLTIALKDSQSFINSFYSDTKYVDDVHSWMTEYYELLWPHANVDLILNKYERSLTSALKKYARRYQFRTADGHAEITLDAINLSGIFMHFSGLSNYLGSSLGIPPTSIPNIKDMWIPISIVEFSKPNELVIKTK